MDEKLLDEQIAKAETTKRRRFNPYRSVMGKTPTAVEMAAWGHDKWMDYLRFTSLFIERDAENDKEVFSFTKGKRNVLDEFLNIPNHPFHEFIYRVDKWQGEHSDSEYRHKFSAICRVILGYLKNHPSIINSDMKILIDTYPKRLGWVLAQYNVVTTRAGEIVQRDTAADSGSPVKMVSLQTKLSNSLVNMADMYERISASVSEKDLKSMKLDEKLKVLKDLSFIFGMANKKQTNHLTQININTKDAKSVEESMLDYLKKTNEK